MSAAGSGFVRAGVELAEVVPDLKFALQPGQAQPVIPGVDNSQRAVEASPIAAGNIAQVANAARQMHAASNTPTLGDKFDSSLNTVAGAAGIGGMAAFGLPMAVNALGGVAKVPGRLMNAGRWAFRKEQKTDTLFHNAGNAVQSRMGKIVDAEVRNVPLPGAVKRGLGSAANGAANAGGWVADNTGFGFGEWRAGKLEKKANAAFASAKTLHEGLLTHEGAQLGGITEHLNELGRTDHTPKSFAEAHEAFAEHVIGLKKPVAMPEASHTVTELAKPELKKLNALEGQVAKYAAKVSAGHEYSAAATGWRDPGKVIRELPASAGKAKFGTFARESLFSVASLLQTAVTGRGLLKERSLTNELYQDLGSNSQIAQHASNATWKEYVPRLGADFLSTGIQLKGSFTGKWGGLGMAAMMASGAVGMAASSLFGDETSKVYKAMKEAHASGQTLPPEAYAKLLTLASKELRERPKAQHFALELGRQYAAEHKSPAEMLKEVENGLAHKRIEKLFARAEENAVHTPVPVLPSPIVELNNMPPGKHVAALNGQHGFDNREVHGAHTAALAARSAGVEQAMAVS